VVIGRSGVLYGTTYEGGISGKGTVFSITPPTSPSGAWIETVLYNFDTIHGSYPYAGVVIGDDGVLFGTTQNGGASKSGTVFALRPPTSPGGAWVQRVLHSFGSGSDGNFPSGNLVVGPGGVLYGTTAYGGAAGLGTVFALAPPPIDSGQPWHETVLYDFKGGIDGSYPYAAIVIGKDGAFYGTTEYGGTGPCTNTHLPSGCGTVFSLTPHGGGVWIEAVLHSFGGLPDGVYPRSPLTLGDVGVIYGTAGGGSFNLGLVFSLTPPTAGSPDAWAETVLHNFTGIAAGEGLEGGVTIGANGVIYGTTLSGGTGNCPSGCGTVFSLKR
jgi:uncharacterized repeat protein (TIGR03803 family)